MKLHFGYLLGLSAAAIAGCAAFFSVYGISQLFAGAATSVIVMASALEFGKLISASYLQRYWKDIAVGMRVYVVIGVCVLVGITSAGIYGFLSNAYQKTAHALDINDTKVKTIELKKNRYKEELAEYTAERGQLSSSINDLSKGLANNVIQYKDAKTGQLITTTSSSTRKTLTTQVDDSKEQRGNITGKMDVIRDSITSLDLQILDLKVNDKSSAELGPLKYLSELTGLSMDRVVNYFILLLIFVFDPLAIALVLATNWVFEFEKAKLKTKEEEVDVEVIDDDTEVKNIIESYKEKIVFDEPEPVITNEAEVETVSPYNNEDAEILLDALEDIQPPTDDLVEDYVVIPVVEEAIVDDTIIELVNIETPNYEPRTYSVIKDTPIILNPGKIQRDEIKEIKEGASRNFTKQIPRRRE
jgi:hypothetical protein